MIEQLWNIGPLLVFAVPSFDEMGVIRTTHLLPGNLFISAQHTNCYPTIMTYNSVLMQKTLRGFPNGIPWGIPPISPILLSLNTTSYEAWDRCVLSYNPVSLHYYIPVSSFYMRRKACCLFFLWQAREISHLHQVSRKFYVSGEFTRRVLVLSTGCPITLSSLP